VVVWRRWIVAMACSVIGGVGWLLAVFSVRDPSRQSTTLVGLSPGSLKNAAKRKAYDLSPVVSGGYCDGGDTLQITRLNQDQTASKAPAKTSESGLR
jgi:hypothetical protein